MAAWKAPQQRKKKPEVEIEVVEGIHPVLLTWHRLSFNPKSEELVIERLPVTSLIRDRLTGKWEGQTVEYGMWRESSQSFCLTQKGRHSQRQLWGSIANNPVHKQQLGTTEIEFITIQFDEDEQSDEVPGISQDSEEDPGAADE